MLVTTTGPSPASAVVQAVVTAAVGQGEDIAGDLPAARRRVLISADDLANWAARLPGNLAQVWPDHAEWGGDTSQAFPATIQDGLRILINGRTYTSVAIDDATRRIAGELIAYDVLVQL